MLGNPVEIAVAVMWKVKDTAKAVFNVDNYKEYLSLQCNSAVRNVVKLYPYDVAENVDTTGDGVGITCLAYAMEIAAAMLQRQQASAMVDARKLIVDGAVANQSSYKYIRSIRYSNTVSLVIGFFKSAFRYFWKYAEEKKRTFWDNQSVGLTMVH